ncbi:MAG: AMP-binding protein, partial [Actinocatenispora sp.]
MTAAPDSLWERFAVGRPGAAPVLGELGHDEALAAVDEVAGHLVDAGVRAGESVGLLGPNDARWVVRLLALIRVGARPLLLPSDAPPPEVGRLLRAAGAGRHLDGGDGVPLGVPAASTGPPGVLLLATSGSTGAPKIVARTQLSLLDEGRRYARAGLVRPDDRVLLPLPLSHAYALGWLAGAVLVGAQVLPASPNALNTVQRHVEQGATVLVSVPGLARVLVRRRSFADAPMPALRLVMCGAGFVDRELDARWSERTGVGVSRNYGSSETGAVLWAPPGGPAGCVGRPMPGVDVRLATPDGGTLTGAGQGEVTVVLEDGRTHRMGDLAERDDAGDVTILGRSRTGVVRRGARWVSTLEVESVLRSTPGVADVAVVATGTPDSDDQGLTAHYVPAGRGPEALADLVAFARSSLAAYKVPEAFRPCYRLRRTGVGKLAAAPVYRPAGRGSGAERAALAAAVVGLGLWPTLTHGATAAQL